jgi:hypothetical protein
VVYNDATRKAYDRRRELLERAKVNKKQWRVSSTMFCHFGDKTSLEPLPELSHLYSAEEAKAYPKITAYDLLMQELAATGMVVDEPERL